MNGIMSSAWIVTEFLGGVLELGILATVSAGILAIAVWLTDCLFRRWISPSQQAFLWGLVLIRLLLPFAPESGFSLGNLTKLTIFQTQSVDPLPNQILPPIVDSNSTLTQSKPSETVALPVKPHSGDPVLQEASDNPGFLLGILPWIWIGVGIGLLASTLLAHLLFCRRLKSETVLAEGRLLELWERCCHKVGFNRRIPMVLVENLDQPAVLGVFRPKLLWPRSIAELSDSQIQLVMLHELGHMKRWDILTNWAMLFLRSVYWWNPIYWIAANRFQNLREQACDAFAIRAMKETKAKEYGELLLLLSQAGHAKGWKAALPVFILGFFASYFRKKAVSNRLRSLARVSHRSSFVQKTFGALLVIGVGWVGLTDAKTGVQEADPTLLWLPTSPGVLLVKAKGKEAEAVEFNNLETREYFIEKLLLMLSHSDDLKGELRPNIESLVRLVLGPKSDSDGVQVNGNSLILTTTPRLHEAWNRAQNAWERHGLSQIVFEVRLITSSTDLAKTIGIPWKSVVMGGIDQGAFLPNRWIPSPPELLGQSSLVDTFPMGLTILDDGGVRKLFEAGQKDPRIHIIAAPKVTQFQGITTTISICDQTEFIVGYEANSKGLIMPVKMKFEPGIRMGLLGTSIGEGKPIHLGAQLDIVRLDKVTEVQTEVGGKIASIHLPRFKNQKIEVSRDLYSGQSLLVGCFPTSSTKEYQYFLFTVRNLDELLESKP